jgi:predicted transcriptional regulator
MGTVTNRVRRQRLKGLLKVGELARLADVSRDTIRRAERGIPISELSEERITRALADVLGEELARHQVFPPREEVSA